MSEHEIMTVKRMKEILSRLDDDAEIYISDEDHIIIESETEMWEEVLI